MRIFAARLAFVLTGNFISLLFVMPTAAHMPVSTGAFEGGFTHPLLSFDHLLALFAAGLWAGQLGSRARFVIPLVFALALWLGLVLSIQLVELPFVTTINQLSLLVLGILIAAKRRLDVRLAGLIVFLVGIFHGYANAAAMPLQWMASSFIAGSVVAALLVLWLVSFIAARCTIFPAMVAVRIAGSLIAATGILMLVFTYTQPF
jgi:urease accessory protein